jgi:hypothetical protein
MPQPNHAHSSRCGRNTTPGTCQEVHAEGEGNSSRTAATLWAIPELVFVFWYVVGPVLLETSQVEGVGASVAADEIAAILAVRTPVVVGVLVGGVRPFGEASRAQLLSHVALAVALAQWQRHATKKTRCSLCLFRRRAWFRGHHQCLACQAYARRRRWAWEGGGVRKRCQDALQPHFLSNSALCFQSTSTGEMNIGVGCGLRLHAYPWHRSVTPERCPWSLDCLRPPAAPSPPCLYCPACWCAAAAPRRQEACHSSAACVRRIHSHRQSTALAACLL